MVLIICICIYSINMYSHLRLERKIARLKPNVITVDIFDTVLLRKWRPESWRFYYLATLMTTELAKYDIKTSPLFLYSQRLESSSILKSYNAISGKDYEARHASIIENMVSELERRKNTKLSKSRKSRLLNSLLKIELSYELSQLQVNKKLIRILRDNKSSGQKIYFISDMYFEYKELSTLLRAKGIDIFNGGISSSDKLVGKYSGRSFLELQKKHTNISLIDSLHIGDNKQSDLFVPSKHGMSAHHLYLTGHRAKLFIGRLIFGLLLKVRLKITRLKQRSEFIKVLNEKDNEDFVAWLLGPAIIHYLGTLRDKSLSKNKTVVFISGESNALMGIYRFMGYENAKKLPYINRASLLRSYAAILNKKGIKLSNILPLADKAFRRKSVSYALKVLRVVDINSNQTELLSDSYDSRYQIDKQDYEKAKRLWSIELKKTLAQWKSLRLNNKPVILADVGWSCSLQILLEEILLQSGLNNKLESIFIGRTSHNAFSDDISPESEGIIFNSLKQKGAKYLFQPEVWESFLNTDNLGSPIRESILKHIEELVKYTHVNDIHYKDIFTYSNKRLNKFMKRPPRKIIRLLSGLNFYYATHDEKIHPMVDMSYQTRSVWKWLLVDRDRFREIYTNQAWKWGVATNYHFRIIYRFWRLKSKKHSF